MHSIETIIALNNPNGISAAEIAENAKPIFQAPKFELTESDRELLRALKISVEVSNA